jgi:hypothetical protein
LSGTRQAIEEFKIGIKQRFKIKDLGRLSKHLGVNYEWTMEDGEQVIVATMNDLVDQIIETAELEAGRKLRECRSPGKPSTTLEKGTGEAVRASEYRSIVGKIVYLTTKIVPEGCNASREMAKFFAAPTIGHWDAVYRFAGYLKKHRRKVKLTYRRPRDLQSVAMVDANYGSNRDDRKSVSGAIYTVGGSITGWSSKTQKSVTLSSTEAEYCAMAMGAQEVMYARQLMNELGFGLKPGIIFEDNTGAIFLARNRQVGQKTKHIDIRHHFVRDLKEEGKLEIRYVNTDHNEADICTKNMSESTFEVHRNNIRNGRMNVYVNWHLVVEDDRREDVKRIRDVKLIGGIG